MHASFLFSCRSVIQASARFCGVFGLIVLADIAFTPRHVEAAGDNPYHWTNTAGGIGSDVAYSVATDPTGNVYVAGYFQGTVDFDPGEGTDSRTTNASYSGFLTKYAADGSYQWTRTADGTSRSLAYSVATDPFGNVYVAGYFSGTADFDPGPGIDSRTSDGNDDLFITKFAADGSYQWTNTADGRAYSVATDPAGSIYVGGIIDSKNVLIKYAPDGTYQWTNTAGGVGYISPTYTYSVAVATDSAGNIYIAGYFSGTADFDPGLGTDSHTSNGGGDIFLTKYDATSAYLWTKTVGSTNQDSARAITIDSADNIYLAGEFEFTTDFDPGPGVDSRTNSSGVDIFVSKYSAEGIYEWTKAVAGGANIQVSSVTTDPAGDIYMAGSFAGGTDFDPGPAIDRRYNYGSANATPDIYLTKYAADGSYQGTKTISGSSLERATALATDSAGDIYMAGYFLSNGLDFDPGTSTDNHYITSIGEFDFFLSKYGTTVYSTPTSEPTSTPGPTPTPTEQPTPTPTPEATPTPTPEPTPTPTPSPSATPTVTFPSDPDFSDGIEPNTGDSNTDFTFKAVYSHPDGTPGTIDLVLEVKDQNGEWQPYGQPMPMSVEENPDYENGAEFSYTLTDEIPAGEYRFAFSYNGGQPQVMGEFAVQASPSLTLSGLRQFDQHLDQDRRKLAFADDPTTPDIREIRETRRYQLVFQAQLQDAMAGENPEANLFLEAEIKKHDEPFTGNPNLPDSAAVVTGNTAEILFANYPNPAFPLEDGNYKWQARVKKQNSEGNWEYSQWQEYEEPDAPDNTDLIIRHTYRVAVILAETADRPHSSTAITGDAPCLLGELANKDYPNGRDAGYYEDLGTCVSDYFDETMYGTMPVEVDVVGGGWLNVDYGVHPNDSGNTLESTNEFLNAHLYPDVEFINKAISQHNLAPQLSNYDAVTVVTAGEPLTRSLDNRLYFNGRTWGWHDYPNWLFRDEAAGENALIAVSLSEDRGLGTWAHELTHALPKFYMAGHNGAPDLYSMGINEGEDSSAWALMGTGLNNGLLTNKTKGKVPPHIISYVKNLLGIHPEEIHPKSDYRDYVIPSLPYIGLLNPIIRYNLEDSTRSDAPSYYLFETRLKDSATWEKELPKDDINLLLYRVDKKYGQGSPRECINVVDILQAGDSRRDYDNNVVLSSQNASGSGADTEVTMNVRPFGFLDHALPIKGMVLNADCDLIAAADAENAPDIIYIETPLSKRIELVNHLFLGALQNSTDKTRSISSDKSYMLTVKSILVISIAVPLLYFLWFVAWYFYKHRQNKPKYFQWKIGVRICVGLVLAIVAFYFVQAVYVSGLQFDDGRRQEKGPSICPPGAECAPDPAYFPPDIDLHAVTPDGRHVGVNYETGEFENEISGSEVSGDLTFSSEWIFVPEIEEVKYYVSSHDRERFFGEHPELQESLPAEEINAEYSIYAKTIDPSSGISESEKQNMVIEPGESVIYTMSAVNPESPSLSEPLIIPAGTAIDITPPATTATLTGTEVTGQGYLPGATLTLTTTDNEGGVGVATTEYSLNDGTAWTPYTDPLVFGDEGEVTVLYRSRDALGNTEETQSLTFTIYVNHAPELAAIGNQTVDEGEELSFTATTTGTAGENGWYTSDITLALAAEDNVGGSGVQQISYSLDSGTTWNIYSTPLNFTQEGETELRFYATDNRGNAEAPQSLTIKIDKAAPATPARPTASAGTDSITLTWPATTDTTSGVAFYTILRNGNPVGTTADLSYTDTGLTPGTSYTYKLTATDLAGNTSAASLARTVLTKTVPMSISFTSSVSSINGVTTATLTWLVTGFTSCTASGGWSGLKALSGTMTVSPVTTTTYILTCTSGSSTAQSSVTVGVGSSSSSSSSSSGGSGGFGGWNW